MNVYLLHMPICKQITDIKGLYFIAFTFTNWLPLFQPTNSYNIVYKWFDYLNAQGDYISGYVITPNHVQHSSHF